MYENTPLRRPYGIHPTLLDVVCCLVFIYMLTSLLAVSSRQEARERTLPPVNLSEMEEAAGLGNQATNSLIVTVKPGPEYLIDDAALGLDQVPRRLAEQRPAEVEIRGDEAVNYGDIMAVLRLCRKAGIDRVALTYKMKEQE
ncbi:MAG: biopolymer transporter ExbD [Kiritimatiellia bacterium]